MRISTLTDNNLDPRTAVAGKIHRLLPHGVKRVLLVNPPHVPEEDFDVNVATDNRYPVYPPYGLGILSENLRKRGYVTDIIDLNYLLQEDLKKKGPAFEHKIWKTLLAERIEKFTPDVIGTCCMFTITHRQMKRTAEFMKELRPKVPIVAGGVHTSQASDLVLNDCHAIDLVSLYEGNSSFGDLLDFANGKAGVEKLTQLAALVNGEYVALKEHAEKTPESVNIKPFYHDLPIDKYSAITRIGVYYWLFPEGTRAATVLSNVGCRAQCTFCSVRNFNGMSVFNRNVKDVVDELEFLKDKYGISHIMWLDDDLFYNEKRAIALFNEMSRRNLGITWDASNGIIASATTEEIAHAAAESGCIALSIGIESGSPDILRAVKKPSGVRHFYRCTEILKKYPQIFVRALLMCGFPEETVGQQLQTVKLGTEIAIDWSTIQPLNLIPGVEITNHALVAGLIDKKSLIDGTERPYVGSTGGQVRREKKEHAQAEKFVNFLEGDPDYVPTRAQIKDIWFMMDYKINYEKLWKLDNPIKLRMLRKMFINICDKTHKENALGNLYFALIDYKLGHYEDSKRRLGLARQHSQGSQYWEVRFEALKLNDMIKKLETDIRTAEL